MPTPLTQTLFTPHCIRYVPSGFVVLSSFHVDCLTLRMVCVGSALSGPNYPGLTSLGLRSTGRSKPIQEGAKQEPMPTFQVSRGPKLTGHPVSSWVCAAPLHPRPPCPHPALAPISQRFQLSHLLTESYSRRASRCHPRDLCLAPRCCSRNP